MSLRLNQILGGADIRSPIFYDSNDTTYYIDAASTSNLVGLTVTNTITGSVSGSAGTATVLQTARNINGTSFNGSAAITTATWGTARTLTIGSTGKSVDGSAGVSWSLAEIGAAATNQTMFIGTTSVAINRASASQTLTGISIDGNAATVTNGVYTTGAQTIGGTKTFSDGIIVNGATYYTFNKPSTTNYQTVALFGSASAGLFLTTDSAIIGVGAYYNAGWIATATSGRQIDFAGGNFTFNAFSGATVGGAASWGTVAQLSSAGVFSATGDFRAPIFYDSNDTAYYLDPANTTLSLKTRSSIVINNASAPNNLAMLNIGYSGGGETRAIDIQGGWSGGENKSITFTHASGSTNIVAQINAQHNSPGSKLRWGKLYHSGDSSAYTMELISESTTSAYLTVVGSVRAPIFYDSANTAYYLDPNSLSNIRHTIFDVGSNVVGATGIGVLFDGNYTSGQYRHRFRKYDDGNGLPLYVDYAHATANSFTAIARFGGGGSYNPFSVYGTADASGDFRAPIFYDSNNTSYYLDPNSTTSLRTVGSWRSDSSTWDGEFSGKIQYHSNHWYFQSGDLWIFRNSGGTNVATINQSGVISAAFSGSLTGNITGNVTGTVINIAGNGAGADPYGTIAVTEPAGASNYSYYGLTRQANIGTGFGLTGTNGALGLGANAFWFGTATSTAAGVMGSAYIAFNGSSLVAVGTADATQFRDRDNTAYYIDAASTSNLVGLTVANTITGSISGNAGTATILQTARNINGTSFNGSAAITTATWGTARTLTIGSTGKSVDGSAAVSWSLAEIGALPLSGGQITGNTTFSADNHLTFGPNSTWGSSIRIGGNGYTATGTETASVCTTDGNLHLDGAKSTNGIYLNWYGGTSGVFFGNGSSGQVAFVSNTGNASFSGVVDATQFRDASNTGYYLDPAGNSQVVSIYANDWFRAQGNTGLYFQDKGYGITSAGAASNSYGNASTYGSGLNGWQGWGIGSRHCIMSNGGDNFGVHDNTRSWLYYWDGTYHRFQYGYLESANSVRGPLFYDSDNTAYYCDPASTSNLNVITAAGNITAAQYYTGGWFRNNSSGNGLYNESTGEHFYSDASDMWNIASSQNTQGLRLRTGGHNGTVRGYFYANNSNDVGFLNNAGAWRLRIIGGDYALFDGSSIRAAALLDSNDTSYYCDPNSSSVLASVTANAYYPRAAITESDIYAQSLSINAYHHGDSLTYDTFQFNAASVYETRATVGASFVSGTVETSIFKGDRFGGMTIANNVYQVRWTWNNTIGYKFFKTLYIANSTNGNSFTVTIESSANGSTWTTIATTGAMSNWPGHSWYNYFWNNNATQGYIRITVTPAWVNANSMDIYSMRYFCSYSLDAGARLYDWDYNRNVTFPAFVDATQFRDTNNTAYYIDAASTSNLVGLTVANTITGSITGNAGGSSASCTGNAATATILQTARNINGTSFNGSAAITTATWGTARTITIGSTGKSVDGSAAVSWSTTEIVGYTPAYGTAAYQSKSLDTITTPGLYQYDGGFGGTKPPDNSPNYRTIEIGSSARFSQIAMPWNSDGYYFRRYDGTSFSTWRTVLHDGNYNSYAPTLTGTGANGSWGISVTGSSASCTGNAVTATTSTNVSSPDGDRNPSTKLPTTNARNVRFDFSGAGAVGGTGNYAGVMTYAPWDGTSASTGDSSYQLAFLNETGVNASGVPGLSLRNGINSTWGSWYRIITSGNIASQTVATAGSCTGNAATVTDGMYLSGTQTITGIKYFQSNLGTTLGSLSDARLQAYATGTNAAFMSFHRAGNYAVNMGLDSDNVLRIGGWSASANRLQLDMSGNLTLAGVVDATQFRDSSDTAYYLDPASTSNFNTWTTATSTRIGRSIYWTNRLAKNAGTNYHTGTNGWGLDEGTWANAWKGGFSGWDIWGSNSGHPQGSGYVHAQGIVSGLHASNSDGTSAYGWMMVGSHNATDNRYWLRGKWDTAISGWVEMLTSGNYNSFSPTLTGTGASGSWGISVTGSSASCTGNSATATTATTATSSGCVNSDTGNVGGSRLQYWQVSGNTTLNPDTEWYNAIRMGHGDPVTYYSNTLAVKMTGSNLGDIYTRTTTNGTAGTWNRFWNNNNDGAGSGLDADLLDGYGSATANTVNTIVLRDSSGNFSAGTIDATQFRDSSNTAFYVDPASTSVLNVVTANQYVSKSATQSLTGTTACTIDVAAAGVHVLSLASGTTISSFTYNNRNNNPSVNTIMLVIKYAGTASISWTNVLWANGVTPSLTATNGFADVFTLTSYQGGAGTPSWIGSVVGLAYVSTTL